MCAYLIFAFITNCLSDLCFTVVGKEIMFLRCLSLAQHSVVTGVSGSVIGTVKKSISLLKAFVTFFSREMEGPRAEWLLFQATNLSGSANNHDRNRQTKLNNMS